MAGPSASGQTRRWRRMSAVIAVTALTMSAQAAKAQVLEIGADGAVTTYDRPSQFLSEGATPLNRQTATTSGAKSSVAALTGAADAVGLSADLVEAVAWRESRLRPRVVSSAGAVGEMQLMPGTARALGVDPYDTAQNYFGGAKYLNQMLQRYDGDIVRALAAYNAGPGAVDRYGGLPPFKETRAYVAAIMDWLSQRAEADDGR
ncbi:MAG: lytic transglycosylase domain-containing protein [Gemmatimonadaceae bacterium]|nr:lytic transglycosylase domain-containing protein [Caulobacter sp.]